MSSRSPRPIGLALCVIAMILLAAPTLFFPADSPNEPKLVFAAVGAFVFALAVLRIRREPSAQAPPDHKDEDVSER
ncbi:hypothetical protein C1632_05215 [Microbacterium testaceum]|uniref:hypothetical protein n=1 Tax=Microbacterium testaceum TaxID=2033 RepID=UPI000CCE0FEF|nr:hypothetical protein [Microbacterium testaceum]PNW09800.1 hypothetical protein C1632_05215 [Microbacterium testaceum]